MLSSRNLYHVTTTVDTGVEAIYLSEINDHDWCLAQSQVHGSLDIISSSRPMFPVVLIIL